MRRDYHTIEKKGRNNERKLRRFLTERGQFFLPLVELVGQCQMAVEDLIDRVGRATIEAVLYLSAVEVAGEPQQGKRREQAVGWYGRQDGSVYLREQKLRVERPRLRRKGCGRDGEVAIPAYQRLQEAGPMAARMLELVLRGVSMRNYAPVVGRAAEAMGISRSSVSRRTKPVSEAELEGLLDRRYDEVELLVIYLDGMQFGNQHVIAAVGVDGKGRKRVLGVREGSSENAAVAQDLLEDLVARGVNPERRYLFVIDGSKALRAAIHTIFGSDQPVQRCRNHKIRNVVERLPKEHRDQVKSAMRGAWRLDSKTGMMKLEKLAQWLERDYPDAAASLREGVDECFTINRLDVPHSLRRCLATTNIIESPQAGVRLRLRRFCRWRPQGMVKRWVGAAYLVTEKSFRRIMGYQDLDVLERILRGSKPATRRAVA